MSNYFIRKSTLLIFISLFFFISYYFKSLPLFLFSLSLTSLFGFFFKFINKNILLVLFSILFSLFIIEITLLYYTKGYIIKAKTSKNFSTNIKYKKSYLGYQPIPGIHNYKVISNGKISNSIASNKIFPKMLKDTKTANEIAIENNWIKER